MLLYGILASLVALTSTVAAETNAQRFKRGLPPLPQRASHQGLRRRAYPSAAANPSLAVSGLLLQLDTEDSPSLQFSNAVNADYADFEAVDLTQPGLAGTFVFSGYYSTDNNRPLYFFKPSNAPTSAPYLIATFNTDVSTVDDYEGSYFSLGAAAATPGPPSPNHFQLDTSYVYNEAAVFQIDRTNPAAPIISFLTIDSEEYEHYSEQICIDGLGSSPALPFLFSQCSTSESATVIAKLA